MDLKAFFESLKDYFLDVIGFLIPGVMLLVCLSVTVQNKYFFSSPILKNESSYYTFIFLIVTYVLGYLVYGLGVLKDNVLGKLSSKKRIEEEIRNSNVFKDALYKYTNYTVLHSLNSPQQSIGCRELRSIVMSFNTDEDNNKIYKFMYRSDLSKHMGNVVLVIGILGLLNYAISYKTNEFAVFRTETKFILLYIVLLFSYFLFRGTRRYFYDIAIKTPFNMYFAR